MDRQTETDRQTDGWTDRQRGRDTQTYMYGRTERQTDRQTDRQVDGRTGRWMDRQMEGRADRQKDEHRQVGRQVDKHCRQT